MKSIKHIETVWNTTDGWGHAALIMLAVACIVQTMFVTEYLTTRPWWTHRIGRALALKSSSLLLALWLTLVNTFFVYSGEEVVGTLVMGAIAGAITYQWFSLRQAPQFDTPSALVRYDATRPEPSHEDA